MVGFDLVEQLNRNVREISHVRSSAIKKIRNLLVEWTPLHIAAELVLATGHTEGSIKDLSHGNNLHSQIESVSSYVFTES